MASEAWQRKEGKNPAGGLNEKGRKSYEKANPGSDLKPPVKAGNNPRRSWVTCPVLSTRMANLHVF
jgi:hypothetical protein